VRIGIDISSVTPRRSGIGTYTYELVRRLVRCRRHEYVLLFNSLRQPAPDFPELHESHVTLRRLRLPGPVLLKAWRRLNRPAIESLVGPVDLFHAPATYMPPQRGGARVVTVHDLYFRESGAQVHSLGGKYLNWIYENRLREATLIVTPDPSAAPDLGRLGVRVRVIPEGVDERFFEDLESGRAAKVRARYRLPADYILHVGTREPRKNLPLLLEGYAIARRREPALGPLVLVGSAAWKEGGIRGTIASLGIRESVHCVGYVAHEDLPAVYRMASQFVFPSRHEGFGLPVLEAMASQTPVICTAPVAAGGAVSPASAAVLDDGCSADALAERMLMLQGSAERRSAQVAAGLAAAQTLTWERCASATLAAYEEAMGLLPTSV
jgi:glycosyltransferase involved in cell wall biosynthesis